MQVCAPLGLGFVCLNLEILKSNVFIFTPNSKPLFKFWKFIETLYVDLGVSIYKLWKLIVNKTKKCQITQVTRFKIKSKLKISSDILLN